ncbi:MAG: CO dehydrogenase/CO-methylating acetyl-CoA synthase complex subunit beta, partial [Dehalococcoidia bacterium]|nr:CO dehydrogenase/CO-methylating acetyl-CoA synthase complex subunit beta [Dehalococcoidia bacterium]
MADGIFPVDIGPQYEGEVIRKVDMRVELGGPNVKTKFELVSIRKAEDVTHEKVEVIGPDLPDLAEGSSQPIALLVEVAGSRLEKDIEPVLERRLHLYLNYIEGFYHMNQRQDVWMRLNKAAFNKGLKSLKTLGEVLIFLYTSEIEIIEKIQVTFVTDPLRVEELLPGAVSVYRTRDEKIRGLREADVQEFYSCALCQSFAPTHICCITPERIANCGAINWFDGKAAYQMDPEGPIQAVAKGDIIDPVRGEYSGADKLALEKSMSAYDKVFLHSAFGYPHTSCGCFQAICFYIPEVDAFGIVNRDFEGDTVAGASFTTMAGDTSGGRQVEGFLGIALEYLRSPSFLKADGGWYRIVWMPRVIQEMYRDACPMDLQGKIATENDVAGVEELAAFLDRAGHPWVKGEVKLPE